jgi:RNA polymerase sigma-70 factor (sigma-E family)
MSASMDEDFREFVLARGASLLRLAYLLTGDHSTAEDLLQTALLRAYRHWARVCSADVPDIYVRRILVNQRVSMWRRRRVDELPVAEPDRLVTGGCDESAGIAERDRLWRALHRLPPRTRAVIVLRYWQDMSETATAELLGCSVGTVKSLSSRGLGRLRQLLDPAGEPADTGPKGARP